MARHATPARLLDQAHRLLRPGAVMQVGDQQVGAVFGKFHGDGAADPGIPARHHRDLARQIDRPHRLRFLVERGSGAPGERRQNDPYATMRR
jgi:hypothetical protein